MIKNPFMTLALELAGTAAEHGEVPIGAVVVKDGEVISKAYNQNILLNDPSAHAEILALRQAAQILKSPRLENCDLYVTLEPCPMCAGAISIARIKRLYYAASDVKSGGIENGSKVFSHQQCHHKPEIYSGIAATQSETLLKKFFENKR